VLLDVANEHEPVVVDRREPAEVAHFAHRHEARFVDNQHTTTGRLLESWVDEQLLQGVGIGGEFLPEHVGRSRRRGATEHPSAGAFDPLDDVLERCGLPGAGVTLKDDETGPRSQDAGHRRRLICRQAFGAGGLAEGRLARAVRFRPGHEFIFGLQAFAGGDVRALAQKFAG
jgi:hypothetical protein